MGIDPGKTGAAALIYHGGHSLVDWPGDAALMVDYIRQWQHDHLVARAALESVHAMPKQGVASSFNFGCNLGQWMGLLAALSIPYIMPRPQQWKKGLVKKADGKDPKLASLVVARRLFPEAHLSHKKHHGRADALLIAYWAKNIT